MKQALRGKAEAAANRAAPTVARAAKNAHTAATAAAGTIAGGVAGAAAGAAVGAVGGLAAANATAKATILDKASEMAAPVVQRAFEWPAMRSGAEERFVNLFGGAEKMPAAVRRFAKSIFETVWAEFKVEVVEQAATSLKRHESMSAPERSLCCLARIRATLMYGLYPHDKQLWSRLRSPLYLLGMALSMTPVFGIRPAYYLLVLMLMDRRDEYQLVMFVQAFKATQFFAGVLGLLIATGEYFDCVTFGAGGEGCSASAAFEISFATAFVSFVANVVLVWIAFGFLKCSRPVATGGYFASEAGAGSGGGNNDGGGGGGGGGGTVDNSGGQGVSAADLAAAARSRAGRQEQQREQRSHVWPYLRWMLLWDAVAFILVVALMLFLLHRASPCEVLCNPLEFSGPVPREILFFCKTLYAISAFPFSLIALPLEGLAFRVLTHARPTGYDQWGRTRPLQSTASSARANLLGSSMSDDDLDDVTTHSAAVSSRHTAV